MGPKSYYLHLVEYAIVNLLVGTFNYYLLQQLAIGGFGELVIKIFVTTVIYNGSLSIIYRRNKYYLDLKLELKKIISRMMRRKNK